MESTKVKLDVLTDINMLLMVKKCIRGATCNSFYWYAKANNKYMKDYDKNKEFSFLQYWDLNTLYGWAMSQKLLVNNFEGIKDTSQFNKDFIKGYLKDIFLKLMFNMLQNYMNFIMNYHFYLNEWKLKKSKRL